MREEAALERLYVSMYTYVCSYSKFALMKVPNSNKKHENNPKALNDLSIKANINKTKTTPSKCCILVYKNIDKLK